MNQLLFLEPVPVQKPWGGHRLKDDFSIRTSLDHIGECFCISANTEFSSIIRGGLYDGVSLYELWHSRPELFGENNTSDREFPLLIKLIEAVDRLSVQVHPDDLYARLHNDGHCGKNECWYILDCSEDAEIVYGHTADSVAEARDLIDHGAWDRLLRTVPIQKGDVVPIHAGTIHSLCGNTLIYEVQQNSNVTYSLYDYGRIWQGKRRPLHIQKASEVLDAPSRPDIVHPDEVICNSLTPLIHTQYFDLNYLEITVPFLLSSGSSFQCVTIVDGFGKISGSLINKGDSFIVLSRSNALLDGQLTALIASPIYDTRQKV